MTENAVNQFTTWRRQSSKGKIRSNVVVVGLHGSGKSTLIKALLKEFVPEEDTVAETASETAPETKVRAGEKHTLNHKGNTLTMWDTCGFFEASNPGNADAFNALKAIPCMKKKKCSALIFTVAITKTRFEKNSSDIEGMKKLEELFGADIWNNVIIVLTQANTHYDITCQEKNYDKDKYLPSYMEWVTQIRTLVASEVMPGYRALTVPIVPAGYLNSIEAEAQMLEFEPKGKSWVLNIWQHLALTVPIDEKPLFLDVCINKMFASKFFFCDSFLSQVKVTAAIYKEKMCSIRRNDEHVKVSFAFSLLHNMLVKIDNSEIVRERRIIGSESTADGDYWTTFKSTVQVVLTGLENSGKTALINSLAYGKEISRKEISREQPYAVEDKPIEIKSQSTTCTFVEHSLDSLEQTDIDSSSVIILCIKVSETELNMKRILTSFAKYGAKHFIIALTYANAYALEEPYESLIDRQSTTLKKILTEKNIDPQVVRNLKIVPAGYHSELTIKNDLSEMHWIMHLWLQVVSNAKRDTQAALMVLVNYHIYGTKSLPKKLAHCKAVYIQHLVSIMIDIAKSLKLDLQWKL